MQKKMPKTIKILIGVFTVPCFVFIAAVLFSVYKLLNPRPTPLCFEQEQNFVKTAQTLYPTAALSPLLWDKGAADIGAPPVIHAASALLADLQTGCILYEKNADILIPPASMTKLALMHLVFKDIAAGKFSLDDEVPLKADSWALNMPRGSSLMFLGENQRVSVRELLLGLAVVSGNDAAAALADFVSGSQDVFVDKMNGEMKKLGLKYTRFVDTSGYSELNMTTAREFASFARTYTLLYPDSLQNFHSVQVLSYPKPQNIKTQNVQSTTIVQRNTNPALGVIEGANGLKTGFIPESGYNLSLTVERKQMSILSVTLGGPGQNTRQGNAYRLKDAQSLCNYAFDNFKTVRTANNTHIPIGVIGSDKAGIFAREAFAGVLTVPAHAVKIKRTCKLPGFIKAPVKAGDKIGKAVYSVGNLCVQEIPLLADRSAEKSSSLKKAIDIAAQKLITLFRLK